jgi:ATP-binding cassette subfamily B protein
VWEFVAIEIFVTVGTEGLAQLNTWLDTAAGELFTDHMNIVIMEHAVSLDLLSLESPEFYDKLDRIRSQSVGRVNLLTEMLNVGQEASTIILLASSLALYSFWLFILVLLTTLPIFASEVRFSKMSYAAIYRHTPERRLLEYLRLLATWMFSAKEVRALSLSPHLKQKYRDTANRVYLHNKRLSLRRATYGFSLNTLSIAGQYTGYLLVVVPVLRGAITLGSFTYLAGALTRCRSSMARACSILGGMSEPLLLLDDMFDFLDAKPAIAPAQSISTALRVNDGIEIHGVSFSYPGSSKVVLDNVFIRLPSNKISVLVGANGSGKSTLIKLICRLYDPTSGYITLDGVDLRLYELSYLRQLISVMFQDFVKYDLSVSDNISFGSIADYDKQTLIETTARLTGIDEFIAALPDGYAQILGQRFGGSVDLSGGQWQRMAFARAMIRNGRVMIFDEPAAHMDAEAEATVFNLLEGNKADRITIVITHRLSHVARADWIVLLERGKVLEQGTHHGLVQSGGAYAHLFSLQAAGYQ